MNIRNNNTLEEITSAKAPLTENVVTVSDFTSRLQRLLENAVPIIWIQGEISNFSRASSGHWYFQLKDENAQISCVMFRLKNQRIDWAPKEGMAVELRGVTSYYGLGGKTQITVENIRQAGLGRLYEAFNALKLKLEQEGLFAPHHKKSLPVSPRSIGIITSPMAAALRDVLSTLKRRAPNITLIIYPTRVQGQGAAEDIAATINVANQRQECEVIILCRGGGSIEDLWAYNEEVVARAIYRSQLPLISGIGHETDFTIADFVADERAPTPTAAAEMVSPDRSQQLKQLNQSQSRLHVHINRVIEREMLRVDQYNERFPSLFKIRLSQQSVLLSQLQQKLIHPGQRIHQQQQHIKQIAIRFNLANKRVFQRYREKLINTEQSLQYLNPQSIMARGFSIVRNQQGKIISQIQQTSLNTSISIQFHQGEAKAVVTDLTDQPNNALK
ncbi:MAG: exodeoxyribonuclease VII large subunit [Ferrovum sp. 37-45-19]|uniref:exodeoxyribonuclease VII large subunit n=1 Tax=Ferrovum sp. JA12 TaxID=1356299 RepID=UPI000702ABE5|nr:exodeoxyribonuclease VII large subunit [Ferrovum sp. JA12]OYV80214.1 MAG: exodeoxyribonuclease VII large subunit [Ferrovum sp. 21-44-67]OYV94491.1 MAG: exodeoxyribonuclease VII large subunit [Ferrovum sp. 37-45-19]OZB33886.1 MAG: exodeoxyribonuclease VII large subunit [Ferrovum sp. 34-44-207]HQT81610.1 exodeoxyribonuclease VII large subunit [Ferrovaceae bacterium]KRH78895.1 exodeoxyribonuclease 7 large subunit [Ferrovum sp. JA12]